MFNLILGAILFACFGWTGLIVFASISCGIYLLGVLLSQQEDYMNLSQKLIKKRLTDVILKAQDAATYGAGYQTGDKALDIMLTELKQALTELKRIELNCPITKGKQYVHDHSYHPIK